MRRIGLVVVLAGCAIAADREDPFAPGGKGDLAGDLRDRLHAYVRDHVVLSYHDAREAMFGTTDDFDLHDGLLECAYTGRTVSPDGTHAPDGFNTEHVWPQSQGAGEEPARSDLHHLFPVDAAANTARASHRFGIAACTKSATCAWQAGGSALDASDPTAPIFEVRPSHAGDIARAKFYFAIRYELTIPPDEEAVLRKWHGTDPPDDRERARNEAIFALQRNHNPFVIWPVLVGDLADF